MILQLGFLISNWCFIRDSEEEMAYIVFLSVIVDPEAALGLVFL